MKSGHCVRPWLHFDKMWAHHSVVCQESRCVISLFLRLYCMGIIVQCFLKLCYTCTAYLEIVHRQTYTICVKLVKNQWNATNCCLTNNLLI